MAPSGLKAVVGERSAAPWGRGGRGRTDSGSLAAGVGDLAGRRAPDPEGGRDLAPLRERNKVGRLKLRGTQRNQTKGVQTGRWYGTSGPPREWAWEGTAGQPGSRASNPGKVRRGWTLGAPWCGPRPGLGALVSDPSWSECSGCASRFHRRSKGGDALLARPPRVPCSLGTLASRPPGRALGGGGMARGTEVVPSHLR